MKAYLIIILSLVLFTVNIIGQEPDWHIKLKDLKTLHNSRKDVEQIFGVREVYNSFVSRGVEFVQYKLPEGKISASFSAGDCSGDSPMNYKTEKGKLIEITFFPTKRSKLSRFVSDMELFEERSENDNPTLHYFNRDEGVDYAVQEDRVIHVAFFPSTKYDKLKCVGGQADKWPSL